MDSSRAASISPRKVATVGSPSAALCGWPQPRGPPHDRDVHDGDMTEPPPTTVASTDWTPIILPTRGSALIKLGARDSGGTLSAFELVVEPGEGPGEHVHSREHELWYVLAGEFPSCSATRWSTSRPAGSLSAHAAHRTHSRTSAPAPGDCW
jgi:hypothetical protein